MPIEQWRLDALRATMPDAWLERFEHELAVRNAAYETRQRRLDVVARRVIRNGVLELERSWRGPQQHGTEYVVSGTMASRYTLLYWNTDGTRAGIDVRYRSGTRHFRDPYAWSDAISIT